MPNIGAQDPLVVVLLGPTGSGKTALSLAIAAHSAGEIVNCDSVAVYRELDSGTAKPSREERTHAPHHLFDIVAPTEPMTAGEYARRARQVLAEIRDREHLPIVVGGTGLYLRALLDGLFAGPERSETLRAHLRERATHRGSLYLHRVLARMDRKAAAKIHSNDTAKLIRAIEVCLAARKPMTELWQQGRDPLTGFRVLRIGLDPDRQVLYERINRRAAEMFDYGLVEETGALLERYGNIGGPLDSLGYRQAAELLDGKVTREQAIAAAQQGHRNYAKLQMTWFRREPEVHWLHGFGDDLATVSQALDLVSQQVSRP
jgi:tRNA dimethylallyltransferase